MWGTTECLLCLNEFSALGPLQSSLMCLQPLRMGFLWSVVTGIFPGLTVVVVRRILWWYLWNLKSSTLLVIPVQQSLERAEWGEHLIFSPVNIIKLWLVMFLLGKIIWQWKNNMTIPSHQNTHTQPTNSLQEGVKTLRVLVEGSLVI